MIKNIEQYNDLFYEPIAKPGETYANSDELLAILLRMKFEDHQLKVTNYPKSDVPVFWDNFSYRIITNDHFNDDLILEGLEYAFQSIVKEREERIAVGWL